MTRGILLPLIIIISAACGKKGGSSNQPDPAITINSVTQLEGNSGTSSLVFTIKLSQASSKQVSVTYSTTEGSAKATEDFTAIVNQTLNFAPNETEKTVAVTIVSDDAKEGDDEFSIVLSTPANAFIQLGTGNAILTNDDTRVAFTNAGYDAPASYAGYSLAWADEFTATTLNTASWSYENGDGCPNICGWGNNELEYYRSENLFFQDGKMIIEARKENFNGKSYTSSKILTRDKKIFKYGRIDIRARLPKGKGIWPAFWMLPQSNVFGGWPRSGEIDMMEVVGHEPAKTHATIHYGPGPGSTQISRSTTLGSGTFNDEFHVFSLEWKADQMKWYLDGNLFSTINKPDLLGVNYPFNEDFFLIFNLAVGGNWPGSPDASTYFPQWLIIDYIRVYQ